MPSPISTQPYADGKVLLHRAGSIATIELNQPARKNAMSLAMWSAIAEIVACIDEDASLRVVLLRGAGGTFSAGADISEFATVYADGQSAAQYNATVRTAQAMLRHLARPTIAVIEGACIGGGCGLALACDLRFAADTARFAITPAKLGLAYSFPDTAQLVEKVGAARAKDMLFSGRQLDATEAHGIGLIDRIVPTDALAGLVADYADHLASRSQVSICAAKAMINSLGEPAADERMDALFRQSFDSADFREGFSAFLQKRPPRFE